MATSNRLRLHRAQFNKFRGGIADIKLTLPLLRQLSVEAELDFDSIIRMLSIEAQTALNFPFFGALSVEIDIHA